MVKSFETHKVLVGDGEAQEQPLFRVNPEIPVEDALWQLAHLLRCAQASAVELCDAALPDRQLVGVTVHCIEGAQAVVEALLRR
ncbi:DUF3077 domain-containing protein [Pseudomonas sp. UBA4194]|uniref:DUF3077 domain-containing protein n=1 Tax=Pseudomonas sp. UBA4194 TaxID=1947317 RepID=UPI0025ECA48E|nr:DUF3077 domain-containing protein [Pseudomonas sp. UBA4194]